MIWFFLGGWICGAVFMVMYAGWWVRKHARKVTPEQTINDMKEMAKEDKTHE